MRWARARDRAVQAAIVAVVGALSATPGAFAASDASPRPAVGGEAALSVAVTATGSLARSYAWEIEKTADAAVRSTRSGGTVTFRYAVTARAGAMIESGWVLAGQVTVTNPHPPGSAPISADVTVATDLGGGGSCAVAGGDDVSVPPAGHGSGQVTLPYSCSYTSAPASTGTVAATVVWDPAGKASAASAVGSAPVSFTVTSETNRTVAVVDDHAVAGQRVVLDQALTWTPGAVKTYAYDLALTAGAPGFCQAHTNTATVDQPSGADPSATITVQACAAEVLPVQAFGRATGSVAAGCRGNVRARLSNRSAETVTYRLRVGSTVHRIAVRSMGHRKFVTSGRALDKVTLKVGAFRLDRIRIPQPCAVPEVLPGTGSRVAGG